MKKLSKIQWIVIVVLILTGGGLLIPLYKWAEYNALSHIENTLLIYYYMISIWLVPVPALVICIYFAVKRRLFPLIVCVIVSVWLMVGGYVTTIPQCPICQKIGELGINY